VCVFITLFVVSARTNKRHHHLQDLVQNCLQGGGGDMGGHVLREKTSRGLCGLGCPSRTGTREEPGTLIQGAPVFPGSSHLGIEPKTPGWLVQAQPPAHRVEMATIGS
jgi:hypothetical protein